MNPVDIVILCIVGAALIFVLFRIKRNGGTCGCGCQNCRSGCKKSKKPDESDSKY